MSRTRVRTDPVLIRRALDLADASTMAAAAREVGVHHRTVHRWVQRRLVEGPEWPTPEDIDAWRADDEANRAHRSRVAAQTYRYRQLVYLNRGPLQVSSLGTARRLQALAANGWTHKDIAARMGVSPARVGHLTNSLFPTVFPSTAAAVDRVYSELCMVIPTDPPPTRRGEVRVHERTRRAARNRGWVTALAWNNIDDPSERPARPGRDTRSLDDVDDAKVLRLLRGERMERCTKAEKEEVRRRWLTTGRPLADLERIHGWKPERYIHAREAEAS